MKVGKANNGPDYMYDISGVPGLFVQRLNDYTEHDIWNGGNLCPARS